ncbi:MAG: ROK family protein [Deltaproteobacteria bacterium]|nr:ROK family protein [Deltaproteobacteria bacterium]
MDPQHAVIGIDLGGTHVRLGLVRDGRVTGLRKQAMGGLRAPAEVVAFLAAEVRALHAEYGAAAAVGVGVPGIVDPQAGIVLRAPHYPVWRGFPMRQALSDALGCPVAIDNDANAIALGEARYGAGKGLTNFCLLTLGTGVGGGIVLNDQLWRGDAGFAGEVGHIVIEFQGHPCPCGGMGHWEQYCSASGLANLIDASDDPQKIEFLRPFHGESTLVTGTVLLQLAQAGNIFANTLWKKFGAYLGAGVASLTGVLGVEHFVIGGGLVAAWDFFIPEARRSLARRIYPELAQRVVLQRAALGDEGGILGAAALVTVPEGGPCG